MMATDSRDKQVQFGDYVATEVRFDDGQTYGAVVRIVKISESPKGVTAVGAYVDLVGNGRIAKCQIDIAAGTLVMRSDGSMV